MISTVEWLGILKAKAEVGIAEPESVLQLVAMVDLLASRLEDEFMPIVSYETILQDAFEKTVRTE